MDGWVKTTVHVPYESGDLFVPICKKNRFLSLTRTKYNQRLSRNELVCASRRLVQSKSGATCEEKLPVYQFKDIYG